MSGKTVTRICRQCGAIRNVLAVEVHLTRCHKCGSVEYIPLTRVDAVAASGLKSDEARLQWLAAGMRVERVGGKRKWRAVI